MAQTNDKIIEEGQGEMGGYDLPYDEKLKSTRWTVAGVKDLMNQARLAALDDCKTLLERVLSETPYHIGSSFDILWAKAINKALAELEALRKKVEA